ncbi:membrane protein insertion efficiency factor YidD (plasmid) [Coraliomargarita sp. W4R53]
MPHPEGRMSVLPAYALGSAHFAASDVVRSVPLLPRNAALALLHGYRATISPTYGDVCKYFPSCSAYAVAAVQQHGIFKGTTLTATRLARCHPWAQGGVDDVPAHTNFRHALTPHGFVVPSPTGKD